MPYISYLREHCANILLTASVSDHHCIGFRLYAGLSLSLACGKSKQRSGEASYIQIIPYFCSLLFYRSIISFLH